MSSICVGLFGCAGASASLRLPLLLLSFNLLVLLRGTWFHFFCAFLWVLTIFADFKLACFVMLSLFLYQRSWPMEVGGVHWLSNFSIHNISNLLFQITFRGFFQVIIIVNISILIVFVFWCQLMVFVHCCSLSAHFDLFIIKHKIRVHRRPLAVSSMLSQSLGHHHLLLVFPDLHALSHGIICC